MYIIKGIGKQGETLYWTGSASKHWQGWSLWRARAKDYKTAKGACSALMRNKRKKHSDKDATSAWRSAYVATSVGVW